MMRLVIKGIRLVIGASLLAVAFMLGLFSMVALTVVVDWWNALLALLLALIIGLAGSALMVFESNKEARLK